MAVVVEACNIRKAFRSARTLSEILRNPFAPKKTLSVLKGVNLTLNEGDFFCLMGPNGAGKTTLLKILSGLLLPEGGKVSLYGRDLTKAPPGTGRLLGFVSGEERSFYGQLTGRQTLGFFATLYDLRPKEAQERIRFLSRCLEFEGDLDKPFMKLSSGCRQRLALARGLLHDPRILFLDEPTKSLDPKSSREFLEWVRVSLSQKERKTVLFTTHRLEEASLSQRVGILSQGRLVFQGDHGLFLEESRKAGFLGRFFSEEEKE